MSEQIVEEKKVDATEDSKRVMSVEAVASVLHTLFSEKPHPATELWRDLDLKSREVWRAEAAEVLAGLEEFGIRLTPNQKKLEASIEELLTIPAAKAFEPGK